MTNIFYTSDHHFGHTNIIKYTKRYELVQTVEEMNELLVSKWNEVVGPNDIVIHLGDVFFRDYSMLADLNGMKQLILGNHDQKNIKILKQYFDIYDKDIFIDIVNELVLSHYPIKDWPHKFYGWLHLHGHSHGTVNGYDPLAIDVGVDCWNMYPVTLKQIRDKINGIL